MTSSTTNKFSPEVRDRAVRMVLEHEVEHPSGSVAVLRRRLGGVDAADGRWCTLPVQGKMIPNSSGYEMTGLRRTESGRLAANIKFSTATPMAASVCWAAKPRARNRGPISVS